MSRSLLFVMIFYSEYDNFKTEDVTLFLNVF